jgi:hypothetical protein
MSFLIGITQTNTHTALCRWKMYKTINILHTYRISISKSWFYIIELYIKLGMKLSGDINIENPLTGQKKGVG